MPLDENVEIETKFHIKDFNAIQQHLDYIGAQISRPRVFEVNYRFDTPDHKLSKELKVLRLRRDSTDWITYKGPGKFKDGIRIRQEIEFQISDIKIACALLEALGYQMYQSYEKYRTVYELYNTHIMLDELPFGTFLEIESTDIKSIKICARKLKLLWKFNIDAGYLAIYKSICNVSEINYGSLSFENFVLKPDMLSKIDIYPADQ
jgi:adenylate cyclase class 2